MIFENFKNHCRKDGFLLPFLNRVVIRIAKYFPPPQRKSNRTNFGCALPKEKPPKIITRWKRVVIGNLKNFLKESRRGLCMIIFSSIKKW